MSLMRPAQACRSLLAAWDAADGLRRARKRNQAPDAIGLAAKRALLVSITEHDPDPEAFEDWLATVVLAEASGASIAMARLILEEWRLIECHHGFSRWLEDGAPSADRGTPSDDARPEETNCRHRFE